MNLNKDNMKKILGVITFTLLLTAILMNMGAVKSYFGFLWGILFPFVMGGAIAFILNLPMTAIERKLFPRGGKAARPVSMVLSILFVVAILAVVVGVVIPQLGKTFDSVSVGIAAFLPKVQAWAEDAFSSQKDIVEFIESMEFDWKGIVF